MDGPSGTRIPSRISHHFILPRVGLHWNTHLCVRQGENLPTMKLLPTLKFTYGQRIELFFISFSFSFNTLD